MEFSRQITINQPADEVWEIVGTDFHGVSKWASPVLESHPLPDLRAGEKGRVCQVKGAGKVVENVHHYDDQGRELAFTLVGEKIPFFVKRVENTWRVEPRGADRSVVHIEVEMTLLPVFRQLMSAPLRKSLQKNADSILGDLKVYAEKS